MDLYLLGSPQVIRDGKRITRFRSSKAQALLHFLAMTNVQRRSLLAALFWPEFDQEQAGASLRNVLSNLRALVGDVLTIEREVVHLDREALWLDVLQFETLLKRTGDTSTDMVQTAAAVSLYRGDFLEGFHVSDAPQFEQWATIERERLRQAVLNGLLTLADWHAGQADFADGLEDLDRLLAIDPAHESGHRQKMIMLARMGQRSAALQQYDVCRRVLTEELDVEPSPQTTAIHELILAGLLEAETQTSAGAFRRETPLLRAQTIQETPKGPRMDRQDMPERVAFHGRREELAQLTRWLTTDDAGLVAVSGMGGIGKTTLVVELIARLAQGSFDHIIWRSLVNAPPLASVMDAWLQALAGQHLDELPESMDDKFSMLSGELERRRCLIVLDNLESIIDPDAQSGRFRAGYEEYGRLIDRLARSRHRSCLLLTTRELPKKLRTLEEDTPRVRILPLEGLLAAPGIRLLRDRGVSAPDDSLENLVERYSGNPLALKLVADTIRDLFADDVSAFLGEETPVFDDIRDMLDEQYGRLSELGREIVLWLAIERKPASVQTLWDDLARQPRRAEFLEVVRSLHNSSLVEVVTGHPAGGGRQLALQNVVMEYLTDRLVEMLSTEIEVGQMVSLHRHALVKAQSREHVQQSQRRVLLEPVARRLVNDQGRPAAVEHLRGLLAGLREGDAPAASYAAANILHLFLHLEADLRGLDFSGLAIRQADLRTAPLAGVNFRGADFRGSVFSETFGGVRALAFSPDGRYFAAGESDGGVFIWRTTDYQLQFVLKGHSQTVSCVAFAPDGATLSSGGFDGRVCLWEAETGATLAVIAAHTDTIGAVAFSPDGDYLVSGGSDNQIVIWNWRRSEIYRRLQETSSVNGLAFTPDGQWLISAKDDRSATIWDWRSGTVRRTLTGHEDKLRGIACSPDGQWAATGGEDQRICLWPVADPGACRILSDHKGWVWSLAFSPDSKFLASASTDRTVRLWDVATGQIRRTMMGHTSWVSAVTCSPDGKVIASGGYDQAIRLWDERTGLPLRTHHGHLLRVDWVGFSPDGSLLLSSSLDGSIHLWDVRSRRHLHRLAGGYKGAIRALAFSQVNKVIAGGCDDHRVYLWDIETGRLKQTLIGHKDLVRHAAFSPDGRRLVTGSHDRTLRIWEAATGQLSHVVQGACARIQSATAFSPDGRILAFGSDHSAVSLLDAGSGELLGSLPVGQEKPVTVAFNAQGQLLACGTECGAIWVWRVDSQNALSSSVLRFRVQPAARLIWRIVFSPDDRFLAVCGDGGFNQVIDLASGQVVYSLPDAPAAFSLAFGGAHRYLATAGTESAIHIRDIATGEVLRTLRGHLAEVTSLDASPAGDLVASSSVDGAVRLWSPETGTCLATLMPAGLYAEMNITGATGITPAQRATLMALGAMGE